MQAALASFATQAAFRLRRSRQLTRRLSIFATTSRHKPGYRRWSREIIYRIPTADTGRLITDALNLFAEIYNPAMAYHRAGVLLYDFAPAGQLQTDLLGQVDTRQHTRAHTRMRAIDSLNERYGKRTVRYAVEDLATAWQPKRQSRSPRYTTHFDELPRAHPTLLR